MTADVIQRTATRSIAGSWDPTQHRLNPPATVQLLERSPASDAAKSIFRAPQHSSDLLIGSFQRSAPIPVRSRWTQKTQVFTSVTTTSFTADDHDATGTDVVFINVQNPSKAASGATQSKIKAHAMRHVHQRKRIPEQNVFRVQRVANKGKCSHPVNQTTVSHAMYRENRSTMETSIRKSPTGASHFQESFHPGMYRSRQEHADVSLVCHHCGEFNLLPQSTTQQSLSFNGLAPEGPSRESFNAFASAASPVTHRVHELMHFCKPGSTFNFMVIMNTADN